MQLRTKVRQAALFVSIIIVALTVQTASAAHTDSLVFSQSNPYGSSYGDWSAKWWQYVFDLPTANHPMNDTTGQYCAVAQAGPVFFLMGTVNGASVNRTQCVVPAGKALFLPVVNAICALPEDDPQKPHNRYQAMIKSCSDLIDLVKKDSLKVTVDGLPIEGVDDFRAPSPIFSYVGKANLFGGWYEGEHDYAFSDGYWVMLKPLPPGTHAIHFEGVLDYADPTPDFVIDVTYLLTVQ